MIKQLKRIDGQLLVALAILVAGKTGLCLAFSVGPGFQRPSNYELVKASDDIVVALAVDACSGHERIVCFQVENALKGIYPARELIAGGFLDPKHYEGPSKPGDFSRARPGTYSGMGVAQDFQAGKRYLLFLRKRPVSSHIDRELWGEQVVGKEVWKVGVHSLSRDREEIKGPDDPWLRTVKAYIEVAMLKDYDVEKQRLRAFLSQGNDNPRSLPAGMVDDVERHFATISRMKSYNDLMAFLVDGASRKKVLYALAASRHPEAFDLVRRETISWNGGRTLLRYLRGVDHPGRTTALIELFPTLRYEDYKREALRSLFQTDDSVSEDHVLHLIKYVDPADVSGELVANWVSTHPTDKTINAIRQRVGDEYYKYWRMSRCLAHLGDPGMLEWAVKALDTDMYVRAVYAIGYSPTDEAFSAAKNIIEEGDKQRIKLLRYALECEENRNPNKVKLTKLLSSNAE